MANANKTGKEKMVNKDDEFVSQVYKLLHMNQTGSQLSGHYMEISSTAVKCDAASSSPTAKIKIRSVPDDLLNELWILESEQEAGKVVAIENSKVVVKDSPVTKYTSLSHVKSIAPEILFYKFAKTSGSELTYFKHLQTNLILGFDAQGIAMDPASVKATAIESLFSVLEP